MNSLLTRNHTPIPRSISPLEDSPSVSITTTVNKPHSSIIRLHAHTEALEESLIKSSRDKRSQPSPQASDTSSSSPQKRGSSEVSSFGASPRKITGRRSQRRFNTLPLPVRAESKIDTSEKEKSKEKDSIWAISGVKLEKFCKNLLKKPRKKHQKDSHQDQNGKSNDSDKDSPGKSPLVRTSSEPRTAGRSRFYVEKVNDFRENEFLDELETKENGKFKKKSDRFLKKKAKSTSLLQRNAKEKVETRTTEGPSSASIPIKIKIRESQSNSSEEAFSPVFLKNDQWSRLAQKPEHQSQAGRSSEDPRKSIVFRNSVPSAEKDGGLLNHMRLQKERLSSQSSVVKITKLEREPCRRSRNINPDLKSDGVEKDDNDYDDVDGVVIKRESILSDASRLKKVPEPSSSSSSKRDKTPHKVLFSKTNGYLPADEDKIRRKTDATGTGYVTSGESYITTSPISGEHSTLSDSGYSVTSNDPLFTDTGFLVLDSVGAASRIGASSIAPRCLNGVKNVNAGHIHSPSTKKENADQAVTPRDIQPVVERSSLDSNRLKSPETTSENQRGATIVEQFSSSNNYCNTYPQVKSSRKISDSYTSNDQTASSMNLTPGEVLDSLVMAERSRLTNRMLGFSRQDFETLKHRAKSVEIILPKRSRQRGGKRRACSISRERLVVTVTTTTEEIRYPKAVHNGLYADRECRESDNLSKQELGISVISNVPDAKRDQLPSLSADTEHKGMQTSPDKMFMTTDFPFTTTKGCQVTGQDKVNSASGRHFSSIPYSEISGDQYIENKGRTDFEDHPSFAATKVPCQKNWIKNKTDKNVFNVDEQDTKSKSGVEPSRYSTDIKGTTCGSKAIHENRTEENQNKIQQSAENNTQRQPKKLSAVSYFDGSKWLTSSDEAASEEDKKTRTVNPSRDSETGRRCVETQTSEDIFLYLVPPTLDQSSQTNMCSVLTESEQKELKGRAEERNTDQTSSSSSGQRAVSRSDGLIKRDQNQSNRRDSVKSIIAHEYGEMYSIFREIPPSLTYLKASLVSNEQFNASKDLKIALEKYPHLRTGSWSWSERSVGGFGLMLASSATQQRGKKIYDRMTAPEGSLGEASELISYRFEPVLEQFKLLG